MSDNAKNQIKKLNQLYRQQDELYHSFAVRVGISDTALWILYSICSADKPSTQYDLANAWAFPKQTVNSAISGLERAGIISLASLPGTRNRKSVVLTAEGKAFCEKNVIPLIAAEEQTFLQFGENERQTFLSLMENQIRLLKENLDSSAKK